MLTRIAATKPKPTPQPSAPPLASVPPRAPQPEQRDWRSDFRDGYRAGRRDERDLNAAQAWRDVQSAIRKMLADCDRRAGLLRNEIATALEANGATDSFTQKATRAHYVISAQRETLNQLDRLVGDRLAEQAMELIKHVRELKGKSQ